MKHCLVISLIYLISACSGGGGGGNGNDDNSAGNSSTASADSVSGAVSVMQGSGDLPELERGTTLAGRDNNNNGIRDDIDQYVSELPISSTQKSALNDAAETLQTIQRLDITDFVALQAASDSMAQSLVCLAAAFDNPADAHEYLKKLEGYTANTDLRADKYIEYNQARDGFVTRLPSADNCQL